MKVAILTGCTATGKSSLAIEWALEHGKIEIINADSMLIYRGMDIGTAKPTPSEMKGVPHHLIDIRDPDQPFTAGDFFKETQAAIDAIHARGNRALIIGGTGFYLKSLLFGLWEAPPADPALRERLDRQKGTELHQTLHTKDPKAAERIGLSDRYRLIRALELIELTGKTPTELQEAVPDRPDPRFELWIVDRADSELQDRIAARTEAMLSGGMVEEIERLRKQFPGARSLSAVGYSQVIDFLEGRPPEGRKPKPGVEGLKEEIALATRQLVKKQRTFFRGLKTGRWFILDRDRFSLKQQFDRLYET